MHSGKRYPVDEVSSGVSKERYMTSRKKWLALGATAATIVGLTACSPGTEAPASGGDAGPVTIEVWGWNAETGEQIADAFNAAQGDVTVEYVLQASNTATQTNFRNAFEAGNDLPCLVQGFAPLTTMVVNGWAEDITDEVKASADIYTEGALAAAEVNGSYYGVPSGSDGQFLIINKATYDRSGVPVPETWEDFIEAGRVFHEQGVDVTNLAGEDPSSLMNLVQQAGAEWFAIDGEEWVVDLTSDESLAAADVIQQLIDGDYVSNQTYQDRPALYGYFDSGNMASTTTQWWSLGGMATNFTASLGSWEAVPIPQFADAKEPVTPGRTMPSFVPKGCENPDAVMAFVDWLATEEGIESGRNEETGAIGFPTQIPDPSAYVEEVIPEGFFNDADKAAEEIVFAQEHVIGKFEMGPNYDAWFPELQDQWGRAVAGEITVAEALQATEDFIAGDLEDKGIDFTVR